MVDCMSERASACELPGATRGVYPYLPMATNAPRLIFLGGIS